RFSWISYGTVLALGHGTWGLRTLSVPAEQPVCRGPLTVNWPHLEPDSGRSAIAPNRPRTKRRTPAPFRKAITPARRVLTPPPPPCVVGRLGCVGSRCRGGLQHAQVRFAPEGRTPGEGHEGARNPRDARRTRATPGSRRPTNGGP